MGAFPSRRRTGRALLALTGVAALAIVAAACSGGGTGNTNAGVQPSGGTRQTGGTATYALPPSTIPDYIFPFTSSAYFSVVNAEYFQYLMYRPLYWFGNGAAPTLNTSLSVAETPQYNGNMVTIKLKGWKFSDGETVDANSLLFWIHMLQAVGTTDWGDFSPGGFPANVSNVRAVNATEVQMTMNKAYNPQWFTDNQLSQITPMPRAWDITSAGAKAGSGGCTTTVSDCAKVYSFLDSQSKDLSGWASSPIWSVVDGPWKLTAFNSNGNSAFVPNTAYSGSPKPSLAKFEEVPFSTENAEYNVLQAGQTGGNKIDVGYLPTTDAPTKPPNATVGTNPVNGYYLDPLYSWSINYFPLNFQSTTGNAPILKQLYFREALQLLMNQKAVIQGPLHGYGQYTVGPVGAYPPNPYLSSQGKAGDPFPYNPTEAKSLLTSNGWNVVPNGVSTCTDPAKCGAGIKQGQGLSFTLPYNTATTWIEQEMTQLQSNASQVGVKLSLEPKPFNQVIAVAAPNCVVARTSCAWDMGNWGSGWTFVPDYYPSGETAFLSGAAANSGGYNNTQNDSMINATLTTNSATPLDNWQDFLAKQVPVIWQPNGVYELTEITNNLRGVIPQSSTLNLNPENWYFVS